MSGNQFPKKFYVDNGSYTTDEDEEEDRITQEGIRKILSEQLGEFEESTASTLEDSNERLEQSLLVAQKKYVEAEPNDTLKALYEVRTRELEKLSHEFKNFKQFHEEKDKEKTREIINLMAELEQLKISLKESQNINVAKTEEIKQLTDNMEKLNKQIKELQEDKQKLAEERNMLHNANNNMHQQIVLLQKGFFPKQKHEEEKVLELESKIEKLESEIRQLELEVERKNREHEEYKQTTERIISEKNQICKEYDDEINELQLKLRKKEMDCNNFTTEIQRLTKEKEDLRYILNRTQATDTRSFLFNIEGKLKEISEDRNNLKEELANFLTKMKEELGQFSYENNSIIKSFKEEIYKLETEGNILDTNMSKNQNVSFKHLKVDVAIQASESRRSVDVGLQTIERNDLNEEFVKLAEENKHLKDKIKEQLENMNNYEKLREEMNKLKALHKKIEYPKVDVCIQVQEIAQEKDERILELERENAFLKTKDTERQEQELLLKSLQLQALEFERMIHEKSLRPPCTSVAVNTTDDLLESLKLHYDTQLLRYETNLREHIKKEFNKKLEEKEELMKKKLDLIKKLSQIEAKVQVRKLSKKLKDERKATVELMKEIQGKYAQLKIENENYRDKYELTRNENKVLEEQTRLLNDRLTGLEESYKQKLTNDLQLHKECFNTLTTAILDNNKDKLRQKCLEIIASFANYNYEMESLLKKGIQKTPSRKIS